MAKTNEGKKNKKKVYVKPHTKEDGTKVKRHYRSTPNQETVTETIQSLLLDPDEGKKVQPGVQQQLLDSLKRTENGERGISGEEVAEKLGLDW